MQCDRGRARPEPGQRSYPCWSVLPSGTDITPEHSPLACVLFSSRQISGSQIHCVPAYLPRPFASETLAPLRTYRQAADPRATLRTGLRSEHWRGAQDAAWTPMGPNGNRTAASLHHCECKGPIGSKSAEDVPTVKTTIHTRSDPLLGRIRSFSKGRSKPK